MVTKLVNGLKTIFIFVMIAAIVVGIVMAFFVVIPIEGRSMLPTVKDKDNVLVLKHISIDRGDVVVFEGSHGEGKLIKRVIALEGDTIELKKNSQGVLKFFVNDVEIEEDYVNQNAYTYNHVEHKSVVPAGCFYYLGDNRLVSEDSSKGKDAEGNPQPRFAKIDNIIGKVILRYNIVNQWEVAAVK